MDSPRSWDAYAQEGKLDRYITIDIRRRMMAFKGCKEEEILDVRLVEDPAGEYLGWIDAGSDHPEMVRIELLFQVQFPGGYQDKVDRGFGEAVRLRIERR